MRDPCCPLHVIKGKLVEHAVSGLIGAAQESNLPSLGLPDLTGFEDRLRHRPPPLRKRG